MLSGISPFRLRHFLPAFLLKLVPALICCLPVLVALAQVRQPAAKADVAIPPATKTKIDFTRDIAPILKERCQPCHGANQQLGGLRLDNQDDALRGGYSGAVIKPGNSAESRLIYLVAGLDEKISMPLSGERLTTEQVSQLRAWIDQGALWPENGRLDKEKEIAKLERSRPNTTHWAFIPPKRPNVPKVTNQAWTRNPIDAYVLARLEKEGIKQSLEADRNTLIRRASLDLVGLPPTPEEVKEFLTDNRPDAYERLVDRLLASPHYGEKWARQWLDLAHYADSDGYVGDFPRPHAWRWRHWVIEALNRNMPFDQFTIEQIAGDLLPNARLEQKIATGFLRNNLTNRESGVKKEEFRIEQVVDRTSTVGTVWLGITVGCARCHDHKYDPISQKDFYQLFAFLNSAIEVDLEAPLASEIGFYLRKKPDYDELRRALLAEYRVPELQAEWEEKTLDASMNPRANFEWRFSWDLLGLRVDYGQDYLRLHPTRRTQKQQDKLTDHFVKYHNELVSQEQFKKLKFEELGEKLERLAEEYPELSEAPTIVENSTPPKSHLLIRGDYLQPGIEVQPGTPSVLNPLPAHVKTTRLNLAHWLVSPEHPLTARVTVNRMWQEFFGRGLAETSEDFGTRGKPPTHPELLDWLATEFIASNWNVKKMHKLIVTSATYRQSSKTRKELQARDPHNKLLARQLHLRLSAELIRDVTLAVSGLLNPTIGGKSIRPPLPASGYVAKAKWKENEGAERYRRGLYIFFQRTSPYPQLMNFDAPDSLQSCVRRERSTTPLQALNLLNDPVFMEAAQALAVRIVRGKAESLRHRLDYAFRLCLGRGPRPAEEDRLTSYYLQEKERLVKTPQSVERLFPAKGVEGIDVAEAATWVGLSSVLLNLDEFITRR